MPCQSAGLKSFLRKPYDNLLLIDLVCYGVPSRKLYRKYLEYLTDKYHSGIVDVRFRDKTFGYAAPSMCIELADGRIKSQNNDVKSFLRTFFAHLSMRPSCHNCSFKGLKRNTDLTVGDIKNIGAFRPEMDDDRGTTLVYVHSEKGRKILEELQGSIKCGEVPIGNALNAKSEKVTQSAAAHPMRADFFREIDTLPYPELIHKYCPAPPKDVIASIVKQLLLTLGLNKTGIMKIIKKYF